MGAHKKALLQSLPFLAALLIPLMHVVRWEKDAPALAILLLVPATITGYFCYSFLESEGGGGLCLNQRYLLPCLPFFCILTAYAMREVTWGCNWRPLITAGIAAALITAGMYFLLTLAYHPAVDQLELPLLVIPLWIAVALALSVIVALSAETVAFRPGRLAAWSLLMAALTWSTLVALCYDFPAHRYLRKANYDFAQKVLNVVAPDSVFVAGPGFFTSSVALVERSRVRLVYPVRDRFADLSKILAFHRAAGRPAFGVFRNEQWSALQAGPLKTCRIVPLVTFDDFYVAEIISP